MTQGILSGLPRQGRSLLPSRVAAWLSVHKLLISRDELGFYPPLRRVSIDPDLEFSLIVCASLQHFVFVPSS